MNDGSDCLDDSRCGRIFVGVIPDAAKIYMDRNTRNLIILEISAL